VTAQVRSAFLAANVSSAAFRAPIATIAAEKGSPGGHTAAAHTWHVGHQNVERPDHFTRSTGRPQLVHGFPSRP